MRRTFPWLLCALITTDAAFAQDFSAPGAFQAGRRVVTVTRADATTFTAQVFYPATARADNAPVAPTASPFASISFGHGFFTPVSQYRSTLEHLATWGFVVVATDSQGGLFPSHSAYATDLSTCITWLQQQNAAAASFLFQRIDTDAFGISGHSMGGGASILAAAADARIRAMAVLAPANTNPSAIAVSDDLIMPSLLICGDSDTIVPTATNGQQMYGAAPGPRQLISIRGGFHCGSIDSGMLGCDSAGAGMTRTDQLALTRSLLTRWFILNLSGGDDPTPWPSLWTGIWGPDAPGEARLIRQADANASLSVPARVDVAERRTSQFAATISSSGASPTAFELAFEAPGVAAGTVRSGSIAPGAATAIGCTIAADRIPGENPSMISLLVSARNLTDGATRTWARTTLYVWCAADINRDSFLDFFDFDDFVLAFESGASGADFNDDGFVDFFDFDDFVAAFEGGC
jgi:dienelactone hydrolase